jgi:hypothetical protein
MRAYWSSGVAFACRVVATSCVLAVAGMALSGVAAAAPVALAPATQSLEVQAELDSSSESPAEAKANLGIQHQASHVNLVGQLEEELGKDYAGVWFDTEAGEFVVPIATAGEPTSVTKEGRQVIQEEFASAALPADMRAEVVKFSQEELELEQSKANEALAVYFEGGQVQTGLNPKTNALVVHVHEGQPLVEAEIQSALSDVGITVPIEIQEDPSTTFEATVSSCNEATRQCDLPVRGGEEIFQLLGPNIEEYSGDACTAGFRANGNDGRKYILTAGHCHFGPNGENIWNWQVSGPGGNHLIGSTSQWNYPGRDWMKIDATGTWADQAPWPTVVAYWGASQELPITGEAVPYVGGDRMPQRG